MSRLYPLLLIALLVVCACAAPHQVQKRSFKIDRVRQHNYVPDGPFQLRKAYRKFGIASLDFKAKNGRPRVAASNGTGGGETGDVSATPAQNDAEFLSPVKIGGQTVVMDFDSGSSDMWVFNTNLKGAATQGHTIYDPSKSTTAKQANGQFNISYGDGSFASGPVVQDQVDIGGAVVDAQVVGVPDTVSQSFIEDANSNGLVGLAFSQLNTVKPTPAKTFFANVAPQLKQQVFTANLKHGTAGAYEFGNIDTTQFQGELTQVPVDQTNGFWQFDSAAFTVGNGQLQQNIQSGTAIADTGTSLMIVDSQVVQAYYSQVQGAVNDQQVGGVTIPCNAQLPDLQVAIGTAMATIPGNLMNFAPIDQGGQTCFGAIQSNAGTPLQIYGDIFFKAQFVAFQATQPPSLGIAPHA